MIWALAGIAAFLALLVLWQAVQLQRIRRKVDAVPEDGNVVAALGDLAGRTGGLEADVDAIVGRLEAVEARVPLAVSRTGVVAFDAFGDITGNQSRSIALLSERGDGIVITMLVARGETRFFVKQVRAAHGSEPLAPEEQTAVERAMGR